MLEKNFAGWVDIEMRGLVGLTFGTVLKMAINLLI